jgi:hypothetical protein
MLAVSEESRWFAPASTDAPSSAHIRENPERWGNCYFGTSGNT